MEPTCETCGKATVGHATVEQIENGHIADKDGVKWQVFVNGRIHHWCAEHMPEKK